MYKYFLATQREKVNSGTWPECVYILLHRDEKKIPKNSYDEIAIKKRRRIVRKYRTSIVIVPETRA